MLGYVPRNCVMGPSLYRKVNRNSRFYLTRGGSWIIPSPLAAMERRAAVRWWGRVGILSHMHISERSNPMIEQSVSCKLFNLLIVAEGIVRARVVAFA